MASTQFFKPKPSIIWIYYHFINRFQKKSIILRYTFKTKIILLQSSRKIKALKFKSPYDTILEKFNSNPELFKDNPHQIVVFLRTPIGKVIKTVKKKDKNAEQNAAQKVEQDIKQNGIIKAADNIAAGNSALLANVGLTGINNSFVHKQYMKELNSLRAIKSVKTRLALKGSNFLTIDKMFVSGFESTPYSAVLPQLRPKLDIPNGDGSLDGFPVASKLMMLLTGFGKLDTYLNFVGQYSFANIPSSIPNGYHKAYLTFSSDIYTMIQAALQNGQDVNQTIASTEINKFLCKDGSDCLIYSNLNGNIDAYNYVVNTLLDPDNEKIWETAPGGYAPLSFSSSDSNKTGDIGKLRLYMPKSLDIAMNTLGFMNYKVTPISYDSTQFSDPSQDILQIYKDVANNLGYSMSSLFPVFQYRQSKPANLFFFQVVGPYQIIYANGITIAPINPSWNTGSSIDLSGLIPWTTNKMTPSGFTQLLADDDTNASYQKMSLSWNYSLYFPNSTFNSQNLDKYNVLTVLDVYWSSNSDTKDNYYASTNGFMYYDMYNAISFGTKLYVTTKDQSKQQGSYKLFDFCINNSP